MSKIPNELTSNELLKEGALTYEKVKDQMLFEAGSQFNGKIMGMDCQRDITTIRNVSKNPRDFFACFVCYLTERPSLVEWHEDDLPDDMEEKGRILMCAKMYTDMTLAVQEVRQQIRNAGVPDDIEGIDPIVVDMNWEHVAIGVQIDSSLVPKKWQKVLNKVMASGPDDTMKDEGWKVDQLSGEELVKKYPHLSGVITSKPGENLEAMCGSIKNLIKSMGKDKLIAKLTEDLTEVIDDIDSGGYEKVGGTLLSDDTLEATFEELEDECLMPSIIPEA